MKRRAELVLGDRSVLLELEEGRESSTLRVEGRTFVAERRELLRQDASGDLVSGGLVTSFELGDLDADARDVQVTIFELAGAPKDDHVRLRWRGLGVSSHGDVKGRRFRFAADGAPPRARVGGALEASLFWVKKLAAGTELCAAIGFGSDAFLALDHETFAATPAARVTYDDGHEALVLLSERC